MKNLDLEQVYRLMDRDIIKGRYGFAREILDQFRNLIPEEKRNFYDSVLKTKAEEKRGLEKGVA